MRGVTVLVPGDDPISGTFSVVIFLPLSLNRFQGQGVLEQEEEEEEEEEGRGI